MTHAVEGAGGGWAPALAARRPGRREAPPGAGWAAAVAPAAAGVSAAAPGACPSPPPVRHRWLPLRDGVRLHLAEAGPARGPLTLLLHGFPECWATWHQQLPALAAAGRHVVAPDLRGYSLSDAPRGWRAYTAARLVADVAEIMDACGAARADLVGHDFGAVIAWQCAMQWPQRLRTLTVLNVPHPRQMRLGLRQPAQLRRSWYMLFFQLPWLPEWLLARHDHAMVRAALAAYPAAYVETVVAAVRRQGDLHGPINYYRAACRGPALPERRIDVPTLVLWGEQDVALGRHMACPDLADVPNLAVHLFPDASHWVHLDEPERVRALVLEHVRAADDA